MKTQIMPLGRHSSALGRSFMMQPTYVSAPFCLSKDPWMTFPGQVIAVDVPGCVEELNAQLNQYFEIGTGGIVTVDLLPGHYLPTGMELCTFGVAPKEAPTVNPTSLVTVSEQVATIKRYFSLTLADLARVLGVERPTVYSWMAERSSPHAANRDRIGVLYDLAKTWRSSSSIPVGSLLRLKAEHGKSLFEYLTEETLDQKAIRGLYPELRKHSLKAKSKRVSPRTAESEAIARDSFDVETSF